jgi:hypothetical protein
MSVRQLSNELQEIAIKELNEDSKRIPDDLAHIKNWLKKQPHITARTDDQLLLTFLRGCKFSLERTKEKIDMHYTLKTITPEIYTNRDPLSPEIQKVLAVGPMLPLPKLAHAGGPRYNLARNSLVSQHDLEQADVFKVSAMIQDILLLEDDNLAVAGTTLLHDMSNLSMTHIISTVSPSLVKKIMTCVQHGYPNRIKGAIFFNVTPVFDAIHKVFRPFLTEKVRDRMRICKTSEDLFKTVPKEVLPEEYGGSGGKMEDIVAYWKAKVESYRDWFLQDAKYGTNEKKRPGKPKTSESVYGLDGSFRKLEVD